MTSDQTALWIIAASVVPVGIIAWFLVVEAIVDWWTGK